MSVFLEKICLSLLTEKLGFQDYRTTIKWLKQRHIPFKKEGGEYMIFSWHVEFSKAHELAEELKIKFPSTWHKILITIIPEKEIVDAIFEIIPPKVSGSQLKGTNVHKFFK